MSKPNTFFEWGKDPADELLQIYSDILELPKDTIDKAILEVQNNLDKIEE